MSPRNVPQAESFFQGYVLQVITGSRYLGGFVGMEAAQARWLEERVEGWRALVTIMDGVAGNYPHTAYVGLKKFLQQECYLV